MFNRSASLNCFEGALSTIKKWLCCLLCIAISLFFSNIAHSIETTEKKPNTGILARVGDEVITQKDLDEALTKLPERKREQYRDRILDLLIEVKVFSNEALKAGLDKDPGTAESIQKAAKEIMARYFIKKYVDTKSEPSEEEMKKYYSEHKEMFVVPEGILIQQIVAKNKQDAEAILEELKKGASFEELAKTKSIVSSAKDGGRLGWLYKGRMDPALEKAAFGLEKEKLSDIIETRNGLYQIVKVLEKSDKKDIPFEEARAYIRNELFWKKKNALIDTYYEKAKLDRKPAEKDLLFKLGDESFKEELIEPILSKVPEKDRESVRTRWVNYLIETTVFSREARKAGLEKDPEVVDELKKSTNKILADAFSKTLTEKFLMSDTEAADYYHAHPEEFRIPAKVLARGVIMKTKEDAEIIKTELEKGVAFESLAAKHTSYRDKLQKTVDMGWFGKGEKDPLIEKAAFSLKEGENSDIIKTDEGYLILKVLKKGGGGLRPFKEVKELIKMKMMAPKFREAKQQYYDKAGVKIISTKN
jgi:peptidyl-prolyl cis-trans isomerase C